MKALTDTYTLHNGVKIPCVGFGMWQTPDGDVAIQSALTALNCGYRHIDTAERYFNEESVGIALKKTDVNRDDIFITSKLANTEHGYAATHAAFKETMQKLGIETLDLFLIHWPNPIKFRDCWEKANAETWKAFEELYNDGRIRSIGISNFHQKHIEALSLTANIAPMVNQIRLCPGDTQDDLTAYCRDHNILLEAYSPLGTGKIFDVPEMKNFARKYGKSIAQICIRWSLQMGFLPLPKSVTPDRIRENAQVFDFELEPADVKAIADLKGCVDYSTDPDTITW